MTETEMRELDAWIAEHVFGKKVHKGENLVFGSAGIGRDDFIYSTGKHPTVRMWCEEMSFSWSPTSESSAAMQVLEKCATKLDCEDMRIGFCTGNWSIQSVYREDPGADGRIKVWALPPAKQTLPIAICLFARKLFEK